MSGSSCMTGMSTTSAPEIVSSYEYGSEYWFIELEPTSSTDTDGYEDFVFSSSEGDLTIRYNFFY